MRSAARKITAPQNIEAIGRVGIQAEGLHPLITAPKYMFIGIKANHGLFCFCKEDAYSAGPAGGFRNLKRRPLFTPLKPPEEGQRRIDFLTYQFRYKVPIQEEPLYQQSGLQRSAGICKVSLPPALAKAADSPLSSIAPDL